MILKKQYTLEEIASHVGATFRGSYAGPLIDGIAPLDSARLGEISFFDNPRYRKFLNETKASAVIISPKEADSVSIPVLIHPNPYLGYAKAASLFCHKPAVTPGIHPSAVVEEGADISPSASIGPHCYVGRGVHIGANTVLEAGCSVGEGAFIGESCYFYPRVTLYHGVKLGNSVILHSGVVLGSDGFGNANDKGVWVKIPQLGTVIVGNHVEIGANTTVDRGALGDTVLEDGVRLDNHIQVGHNVYIGAHTAIAACTGISGSTKIGKYCRIAGMVGFNGHLEIGDGVVITGMSMVTKSLKGPGVYSSGTPAEPYENWRKNVVRFRRMDEMNKRIIQLEQLLLKQEDEKKA